MKKSPMQRLKARLQMPLQTLYHNPKALSTPPTKIFIPTATPTSGRSGYDEIIKNAIKDGRVLDYNEKRRDDLSVIAKPTRLGNITKSSLEKSISQFRKKVNAFKEKIKFLIPTATPTASMQLTEEICSSP